MYNQLATPDRKTKSGGQTWQDSICTHCHLHPETFDHLLRCNEPDAITFRIKLIPSVVSLCSKYGVPGTFQTLLTQTIEEWISDIPPHNDDPTNLPLTTLLSSQHSIKMNNFMRGFLSIEWSHYLTSTTTDQPMRCTHHTFFTQLITTLWTAQTDFWIAYQSRRHSTQEQHDNDSDKISELKEEIRFLFSLQTKVLTAHTATYFPQDPESFLKHSTASQLHSYISNYGKAIKSSIQQAQKQSTSNTPLLFTFPGFHRLPGPATPTTPPNHLSPAELNLPVIATDNAPHDDDLTNPHETNYLLPPAMPPETLHELDTEDPTTTQFPAPPPPAPDEPPPDHRKPIRHIQQSLLLSFRRIRNIREITPPPTSETDTTIELTDDESHTAQSSTSTEPEQSLYTSPAHQPAPEARATLSYKHSKWRPSAAVRDNFSQYFQPRR